MLNKLTFSILCLVGGLAAQQTTSPHGYLKTAGNSTFPLGMMSLFGNKAWEIVQIDDTQRGRSQTIRAIHLRRSGDLPDNHTATARSLNFKMRMAYGDYSKLSRTGQLLDSLLVGKWVDVFPTGTVKFPDMTKRPSKAPAPWTLRIPLKTPFVYDGKNALYFQMTAWNPSSTTTLTYDLDAINERLSVSWGKPIRSNTSCKHKGKEVEVSADFFVQSMTQAPVQLGIMTFPQITTRPNETLAFIGLRSIDVKIPGVCSPLLAQPLIAVPMFTTARKANGVLGYFGALTFPYSSQLVGTQLTVQTWAPDPTQRPIRVAGSSGWRTGPLPTRPALKTRVAFASILGTPGVLTTRSVLTPNGGVIVGLEK